MPTRSPINYRSAPAPLHHSAEAITAFVIGMISMGVCALAWLGVLQTTKPVSLLAQVLGPLLSAVGSCWSVFALRNRRANRAFAWAGLALNLVALVAVLVAWAYVPRARD